MTLVMWPKLDVLFHLPNVYINFQNSVSKHFDKVRESFVKSKTVIVKIPKLKFREKRNKRWEPTKGYQCTNFERFILIHEVVN